MKIKSKILRALSGIVATATVFTFVSAAALRCDVNDDDKINSLDAAAILKADAGIITLTDTQKAAADANGDGKVNSLDAAFVLKYDAGIIDIDGNPIYTGYLPLLEAINKNADEASFALYDVNDDGISELFTITQVWYEHTYMPYYTESENVYTLSNGQAVELPISNYFIFGADRSGRYISVVSYKDKKYLKESSVVARSEYMDYDGVLFALKDAKLVEELNYSYSDVLTFGAEKIEGTINDKAVTPEELEALKKELKTLFSFDLNRDSFVSYEEMKARIS